ncbi:hypothetical protein M408DRAFT_331429 [Serendipita vermifera MAFF 305830]|uniref:Uncharacterized protein n=1 Tax=Serendipita vermifera MAFF 305830 TaxID=933852 RepID=A0A0C3AK30_SERVB|nr:hypothetical protein M408DRAFT_331429 [Serendipita vermifera MAFF 305830]
MIVFCEQLLRIGQYKWQSRATTRRPERVRSCHQQILRALLLESPHLSDDALTPVQLWTGL